MKGTGGSGAIQVDAHASIQYSSVEALFPNLRGLTQAPARAASTAATRPGSTRAITVDGGTIEYFHAVVILDDQSTTATPASGFDASKVKDDGRGWPTWGPGRAQGSGLQLRRSLEDVLVVMFATMANESLSETSDVTCNHASSALAAAKAVEDGTETGSETEETEEDEADLLSLVKSDPAKYQEASGAVEGPPHLPSATLPFVPVNRAKWRARSNESWYLVPPLVAHRERAELMRALRDPSHRVSYPAGAQCPYYGVGRASKTPLRDKVATVELEDGVLLAAVKVWRFHKCLYRVLPDGKARGVVFSSLCTAYSEAFLFKVAVNLARNGGSLHSTACLREAFVDLHTGSKYPPTADRLRSVTTLRQALLLYLSLVLRDLPFDSMSCETCRLPDSSYAVVMFDGLQLGYRVKYKKPFHKTEVKIRAVARASLVPSLITDEAVSKAFGAVLSAKQDVVASASSKPITTAASIRGHVMAVEMLLGNVEVNGAEKSFARSKPHMIGGRSNRGWDAVVEGGVAPQLVAF